MWCVYTYSECVRCVADAILTIVELNACRRGRQTDDRAIFDVLRFEIHAVILVDGFPTGDWKLQNCSKRFCANVNLIHTERKKPVNYQRNTSKT